MNLAYISILDEICCELFHITVPKVEIILTQAAKCSLQTPINPFMLDDLHDKCHLI